jgi:asparagine N-glycosylation enzyme membrane subunit Stt3
MPAQVIKISGARQHNFKDVGVHASLLGTGLLDLGWSDASGYFAQAKAIMKDGYPYLNLGYKKLPSIWPWGYPALMLPWLKILPDADSILAPFRTNQTIGLLLLLATFAFYSYLKMPLTGGFAALLLATLPGFFTFCRSSGPVQKHGKNETFSIMFLS